MQYDQPNPLHFPFRKPRWRQHESHPSANGFTTIKKITFVKSVNKTLHFVVFFYVQIVLTSVLHFTTVITHCQVMIVVIVSFCQACQT